MGLLENSILITKSNTMKIIFKLIKPILASFFVLIFIACDQESLNEEEGGAEEVINAETKDEAEIWQELDVFHAEVQEELNAMALPENPLAEKIPNPFLPLIQVNELASGNALHIESRSYDGGGWFERSDYKRVDGEATEAPKVVFFGDDDAYYEMAIRLSNYGNEGTVRLVFEPDHLTNQYNYNNRQYRFVLQRLDGSNWVTVLDKSGVIEPEYWTQSAADPNLSLHFLDDVYERYVITDNNQRNKWYRATVYGYVDYPNESVWRHITVSAYLEKFDPGF